MQYLSQTAPKRTVTAAPMRKATLLWKTSVAMDDHTAKNTMGGKRDVMKYFLAIRSLDVCAQEGQTYLRRNPLRYRFQFTRKE